RRPLGATARASATCGREDRAVGRLSSSVQHASAARLRCGVWLAQLSRRRSLDEREIQRDLLEAAPRIAELSEEHLRGDLAGFLEWLSNAREFQVLGKLAVVESDDGQLIRHADLACTCGA